MNVPFGQKIGLLAPLCGLIVLAACGGGAATQAPKTAPAQQPAATAPAAPAAKTEAKAPAQVSPAAPSAASPAAKAASPVAAPAVRKATKNLGKIVISQPSSSLGFSPGLIADKLGYFKDEGLEAEIILAGSGSKAGAAVIGGSAQFGFTSLDDMVGAVEKGQDLKVFAVAGIGSTTGIVLRKSVAERLKISDKDPIEKKVQALKGLKLAISTPGSGTDQTLRFILRRYGVDPEKDLEILTTGSVVNSLAAYVQGSADGASLSSPSTETAVIENDGLNLINTATGEVPELTDQINVGFWSTGDWITKNPEVATAATIALWRALDYMQQNPDPAAELVRKEAWDKTDPRVFKLAWESNQKATPKTPEVDLRRLKGNIDYIGVTSGQKMTITPDQIGTNKIVEMAKKELGR